MTESATSGDVAGAVGVSAKTITRWAEAGKIPGRRLPSGHWRFDLAAVLEHIGEDAA